MEPCLAFDEQKCVQLNASFDCHGVCGFFILFHTFVPTFERVYTKMFVGGRKLNCLYGSNYAVIHNNITSA